MTNLFRWTQSLPGLKDFEWLFNNVYLARQTAQLLDSLKACCPVFPQFKTSLNQTADFENWISLVSLSTNLPYTSVHEFFSLYLQYHSHSGHEATFSSQLIKSMKHTHTHWITQPNHAISRVLLSRVWIKHNASVSQIILTGEVWTANIFVWCCPPAWINGI